MASFIFHSESVAKQLGRWDEVSKASVVLEECVSTPVFTEALAVKTLRRRQRRAVRAAELAWRWVHGCGRVNIELSEVQSPCLDRLCAQWGARLGGTVGWRRVELAVAFESLGVVDAA